VLFQHLPIVASEITKQKCEVWCLLPVTGTCIISQMDTSRDVVLRHYREKCLLQETM